MENIFAAWREFRRGKGRKPDVQEFELNLEDNLFGLQEELKDKTYKHSHYTSFYVRDPKLRHIHKATVRDRVLHHAVFRVLYPLFDRGFIFDSYSCRLEKGTHRAVDRLEKFCRQLSRNNHQTIFALKCDVRKFFDSVNQEILLNLIRKRVGDEETIWLVEKIIGSFKKVPPLRGAAAKVPLRKGENSRQRIGGCINVVSSCKDKFSRSWKSPHPTSPHGRGGVFIAPLIKGVGGFVGLPLGNVTSQLFANIYLDELDQFIKHELKIEHYLRYSDDFVILNEDKRCLFSLIPLINKFLQEKLKLDLHERKIIVRKYSQGVDFLGYVALPHYRVLRTKTKRRILRKIKNKFQDLKNGLISKESFNQSLQSYFGVLGHCAGQGIKKDIENMIS